MNVAENLLLQQMPNMAGTPKTGGGSKDQSGNFQDLMNQAGQNTSASNAAEKPEAGQQQSAQTEKPDAAKTEQKAPVQKKDGEDAKPQELHGDPNAVNIVFELFRPEIVDVSQVEAVAEAAVEVPVEMPVMDAAADVAVETGSAETLVPEMEAAAPEEVPEAPVEFRKMAEQPVQTEVVRETGRPVENEKPVEAVREDAPEVVEKTTDTGELKDVRPAEEAAEDADTDTEDALTGEAAETPQHVFHDVKAAPVKVAETYEAVDTRSGEMDGRLAAAILQAAENGVEKIQIQLTPANLGALTIDMTRDASGALQVVIHAASSKAAGLLSQHLDSLHTALQTYGANQPVQVEVQRSEGSQERHMFQQADPDGRGQQQQQQREQRQENEDSGEDFLQRLRLGLTGLED